MLAGIHRAAAAVRASQDLAIGTGMGGAVGVWGGAEDLVHSHKLAEVSVGNAWEGGLVAAGAHLLTMCCSAVRCVIRSNKKHTSSKWMR